MKSLVIIFATTIVVRAYRDGRAITSYGSDFMTYRSTVQPEVYQHGSFRGSPDSPLYRHPYRSAEYPRELSAFKDQSPWKEKPSYKMSGTFDVDYRSRDRQFYGDDWPYREESTYKKRFSFRDPLFTADETFFKDVSAKQQNAYNDGTTFVTENFGDHVTRASYRQPDKPPFDPYRQQQRTALNDKPQNFVTAVTTSSYREQSSPKLTDLYNQRQRQNQSYQSDSSDISSSAIPKDPRFNDKQPDSYAEQREQTREPLSFGGHSNYLKYGNHGLGFASVPAVSSFENALPLETEMSTGATTPLAGGTFKSPVASTVAGNSAELRLTATPTPKIAEMSTTVQPKIQQSTMNLVETRSTTSDLTEPTMSPRPVTLKQSPDSGAMAALPVAPTAGSVTSYDRNVHFYTIAPTSPSFYMPSTAKSPLQDSQSNYLMSNDEARNNLKAEIQGALLKYQLLKDSYKPAIQNAVVNYLMPDEQKVEFKSNLQGAMMNYLLPEVAKQNFKIPAENALLNYLLSEDGKRGSISFPQPVQPEAMSYVQLAMAERPKFSLPASLPIATPLSAVSRPAETINYLPTTMPRVTFVGQDAAANFPIGSGSAFQLPRSRALPASLSLNIPNRLQSNGIHGIITPSVTEGMSANVPAGISANIPASIPTLNFGQSFRHDAGQMRQFAEARTPSFPSGLQLQLGGFGGIKYMSSPGNSLTRPLDMGIAKVGLSLPDFPRQSIPAFDKIGFGQHLWPLMP